ncbi:MAG: CvpA family protein [Pseudomonadota bacterium]
MVLFDIVVLSIIAISAGFSLFRGFVREVLSLLAWITAFFVAKAFYGPLAVLIPEFLSIDIIKNSPLIRQALAWLTLFLITLGVFGLVNFVISKAILTVGLSGTDRMLGMVFGAMRGVFISVAIVVGILFFTNFQQQEWWETSKTVPYLQVLAEWFSEKIDLQPQRLITK